MNKTSIKDSNNTIVNFVGNRQWGGFLVDSPRGCFEFANEQGPAFALLAMEACGYGGSVAAGVLQSLVRDLAEEQPADLEAVVGPELDQEPTAPADPERFIGANESSMRFFPRHTFPDRFRIEVVQGGHMSVMSPLRTEAATIALAILNTVHSNGEPISGGIARAMQALEEHAQVVAIEADRRSLEAEAYAYYRASCLATDTEPAPDWATAKNLTKHVERDFTAIALTAREIHGGAK